MRRARETQSGAGPSSQYPPPDVGGDVTEDMYAEPGRVIPGYMYPSCSMESGRNASGVVTRRMRQGCQMVSSIGLTSFQWGGALGLRLSSPSAWPSRRSDIAAGTGHGNPPVATMGIPGAIKGGFFFGTKR